MRYEADITIERCLPDPAAHDGQRRLGRGREVIGKKIGVTSKVVMDMLGVMARRLQPDFGYPTSAARRHGVQRRRSDRHRR
jgi:2-oxopent-4-enoate/cis-2-oxohex-4-enoate hydratase